MSLGATHYCYLFVGRRSCPLTLLNPQALPRIMESVEPLLSFTQAKKAKITAHHTEEEPSMLEQFRQAAWKFTLRLLIPASIPILFLLGIFIYRPDLAEPFVFVILLVYAALMAFICWQRVGGVAKMESISANHKPQGSGASTTGIALACRVAGATQPPPILLS